MAAVSVRRAGGRFAVGVALTGLAAGCTTSQARVAVEPPPPLAVPAPPPRIILPPDPTPPPPVEEAPAPATPPRTPRPRPTPRPDRTEPPRPAEAVDAAKPANGQDPPPAPGPAPAVGALPGSGAAEGLVRQQLSKAQDDLRTVDYAALSNALKAQYDTAKRFITLGEQALKEQNLIYAGTLADKAVAIATVLSRR
jgi:outer membrane biosynthesis protein TonB